MTKMTLEEARDILLPLVGQTIDASDFGNKNKGKYGHAVEKMLGLNLGSHALDFLNGELKTTGIVKVKDQYKVKEDFKICKVWDKNYIEAKLKNMLVLCYDYHTKEIISVQVYNILEHPLVREQFDKDVDWLLEQPDINVVSQTATPVFVSKTNGKGGNAPKERACYIAGAPASYLLGFDYPKGARKGKDQVKSWIEYNEQTEARQAA